MFDGMFGSAHLFAAVLFVGAPLAFLYLAVKVVRKVWK